jgi:protocatechuate 3,4-dioxygenase beta subunit
MTIRLLVASLLTAAIASADASQQPAGQSAAAGPPASLSGVIVEAQTGSPVAGALVTLIGGEESRPAIRTTGDGRFSFASIRPGDYTLYVSAQSFVPLRFGAASPGDPGTSIVARPGASVTLTVPLVRGGVIAGTVTTEAGDPFIHASIGLWRRGYSPQTGERTIVQVWPVGGVTDDRGQYRLFNVPPGEYFVATTGEEPPRQGPQAGRPDDRAVRVMTHADVQAVRQTFVAPPPAIVVRATPTLTFYPGVARPQDAAPISIAPGQDIASVDFVVKTAPLATVAGSITAGTVAADLSRATIGLRATGLRAIISNFHHMFGWVDGGRFSLMGVHPGEYILFASVVVDQVTLQAEERLTVSGRDISGIALTLEPGITVSGRVQYASAPPELAPRFRFVFRHIDDLSSNIVGTIPAVDVVGARA